MSDAQLNLLYVHAGWIGYGRVGVALARELKRKDVTVYDHLAGSEDYYNLDGAFVPPALSLPSVPGDIQYKDRDAGISNVVCWVSVPSHGTGWYEGQIPICFTMWEGSRLPETFRQSFHEFETIIVPSQQNVELFSKYHDNVKYVPLGIDPEDWYYLPRKMPGKDFNFLIGGSGKRKGGDLAVKAFKKLWGKPGSWGHGPVPNLIIKSPKGETFYGDRIRTVGGYLSREDEVRLYATAHCYLQPSRGEGFGLQPLQALAQGIPTILTDAHGHSAFAQYGLGIGSALAQSDYFIFGDAGDWWEPSLDDLMFWMKDVYDNYQGHVDRARENAPIIRGKFSWSHVTDEFLTAVGRSRLTGYEGNQVWHKVEEKLYCVITNQDHYCEIAGNQFQFKRGKIYYQSADIKRILFEANKLDAACIEGDDPGLEPRQVERFHKNRAQYEVCPNCLRPLEPA